MPSANGTAKRQRLAQRRKALGLTQEALASLLDVERSTVVRWERGETEPLPWIQPRLADALRVSADRLAELLTTGASPIGMPGRRVGPDSAVTVPRQLPAAVADFTGRTAELQALTRLLDDAGTSMPWTVVISAVGGTAGVGKSALAVQWADQVAGRFPDGQLYVNLCGYDRPMLPADALAGFLRALGVPGPDIPAGEGGCAARYRSLLAGRRMLVVLDNARSVEQVRPLLPGVPACAAVVTSRDALGGLVARDGAARLDLDLLPRVTRSACCVPWWADGPTPTPWRLRRWPASAAGCRLRSGRPPRSPPPAPPSLWPTWPVSWLTSSGGWACWALTETRTRRCVRCSPGHTGTWMAVPPRRSGWRACIPARSLTPMPTLPSALRQIRPDGCWMCWPAPT